jgi:Zn finger protein HypA/HybF involved in hydrogenase expression
MSAKQKSTQINYAILAKAHPKRHVIHKYWARKPHNVVAEYIKSYSNEGDVVLDPFVGSGVTAVEALRLNRKAVAIDLNPVATFITRMVSKPVDLEKFRNAFEDIKKGVRKEVEALYETKCPKCKGKAKILATIWEGETNEPVELRIYCPSCKTRRLKKPSKKDLELLKAIESSEIKFWYPNASLRYSTGVEYKEGTHMESINSIDKLFTKRNLLALSTIYHEIELLKDNSIRDLMKFAFTSMVHLASIMCPVANPSPRAHWSKLSATSFWAVHRYWIPPRFMESNVWMLFESAAIKGAQSVLKGKEDANNQIKYYKEANAFSDFENDANILISNQSALDLSNIPNNSIDYVFTDHHMGETFSISS